MNRLKQVGKKVGTGTRNCFVFLKKKTKQFLSVIKNLFAYVSKWFSRRSKHQKFIMGGVSLATLLVITVCCFTFDFSRILGNVYDIDDIGANIDDIKVGDRIDYEVNDFNDWQVLNVNKEDNTIDVVARSTPQSLNVYCGLSSCENFYDTLQMAADKYVDKKHAIKARSVSEDDLKNIEVTDDFWISKKNDTSLYSNNSYVNFHWGYISQIKYLYFVPIVNLNVEDTSQFNIGNSYNISLNNISEWLILDVYTDNNSIDIVPKYAPVLNFVELSKNGDLAGALNFEKNKYWSNNVNNVTMYRKSNSYKFSNIGYRSYNYQYNYFSALETDGSNGSYSNNSGSPSIFSMYNKYKIYYYDYSYSREEYSQIAIESYETGFRPVVTLKYSDEEKDGKDNNNKLEIGDYVKYNANAYKNWKVLDIDKDKNTVDIISGGIVKNVSLEGKEDWENLETIFQDEVDKYKVGKDAISARTVEIDDLDNLKRMKDNLPAKYFLNNKTKYRPRINNTGLYSDYISYVVGIAYYDSSVSQISNDWAILEYEDELNIYDPLVGAYRYTAGLRPIITLKLSEVEEVIVPEESVPKDDDNSNDNLINEQTEANKSSQDVIKGIEIIEEIDTTDNNSDDGEKSNSDLNLGNSVVKESAIKNSINSEKQDSVYREFIIFIVIIILLTIIALFIEKIKNWFKSCSKRKLIISGSALVVVLVITIFGLKLNFSKVTGSVYDIDNISSNIDNIQIGDKINYSANGYSNWEVFNINKEDNTIDIVSSSSAEGLVINCIDEKCSNYHDVLQETANKYLDGKYAISSRSVREEDLDYLRSRSEYFWVDKQNDKYLFLNNYSDYSDGYLGTVNFERKSSDCSADYILPVVTLKVDDISGLKVGWSYTYQLNGISDWIILYIGDNNISIIPKKPPSTYLGDTHDVFAALNDKLGKFSDDNVLEVRNVSASDRTQLNSINYGGKFTYNRYYSFLTGELLSQEYISTYNGGYSRYKMESLFKARNTYSLTLNYTYCYDYILYSGFRPVVTIKYSDEKKDGRDLETELKEGDYVKYSVNGYDNWKVLSIDEKKGTVDIISGGIVKNISLRGKEDYDVFYDDLQKEVDKYKTGNYAVSARIVEHSDYSNLQKINDKLSVRYLLGNKIKYIDKGAGDDSGSYYDRSGYSNIMVYAVGVGYYDRLTSALNYDWAALELDVVDDNSSTNTIGSYEYTAGLRPVITLKLKEVEKEEHVDEDKKEESSDDEKNNNDLENNLQKDNILENEQNKANQSSQVLPPINNNKIIKDSIMYINSMTEEKVTDKNIIDDDNINENNKLDNNYESSKKIVVNVKNNSKRKISIILIILSIILLALAFVLKLVKFKFLKKKDFRVK